MKIACIGNMNNFLFSVTRNLRDAGYDAHLFLVEEFGHFLPLSDSYDEKLPDYIHQLDWYEIGHWKKSKESIIEDLKEFDFIIGTDLSPAFLAKAGLVMDIFTPHGGDIYHYCYYTFKHFPPKKYELGAWWRSRQQRTGARNAKCIMMDQLNQSFEDIMDKLNMQKNRLFLNAPYIYPEQYNEENFKKSNEYKKSREIRGKYDLVFIHHSRHVWKTHVETLHYKANDRIIKGFAKFIEQHPNSKSLLIMFEYGWDFEESKKLVIDLGISANILWLPLMNRKDVMVWLSIADLGIGEVANSWLSYGAVYEFLCSKKPFLGYRIDIDFKDKYPELYPMISANTVDLIADAFNDVFANPEKYKAMGLEGYEWFMKYAVNRPMNELVRMIEEKKKKLIAN